MQSLTKEEEGFLRNEHLSIWKEVNGQIAIRSTEGYISKQPKIENYSEKRSTVENDITKFSFCRVEENSFLN
jgi:hypothetical protein